MNEWMKREQSASIVRARKQYVVFSNFWSDQERRVSRLTCSVPWTRWRRTLAALLRSPRSCYRASFSAFVFQSDWLSQRERERENGCISSVCARKEHSLQRFLRSDLKIDLRSSWREKKRTKKTNSKERKKEKRGIASRVDLYLLPSVFQVDHFLVRERHPFFSSLCSSFVVKVVYVVVYVVFKARPILFDGWWWWWWWRWKW